MSIRLTLHRNGAVLHVAPKSSTFISPVAIDPNSLNISEGKSIYPIVFTDKPPTDDESGVVTICDKTIFGLSTESKIVFLTPDCSWKVEHHLILNDETRKLKWLSKSIVLLPKSFRVDSYRLSSSNIYPRRQDDQENNETVNVVFDRPGCKLPTHQVTPMNCDDVEYLSYYRVPLNVRHDGVADLLYELKTPRDVIGGKITIYEHDENQIFGSPIYMTNMVDTPMGTPITIRGPRAGRVRYVVGSLRHGNHLEVAGIIKNNTYREITVRAVFNTANLKLKSKPEAAALIGADLVWPIVIGPGIQYDFNYRIELEA
jgi:hypothetical protein